VTIDTGRPRQNEAFLLKDSIPVINGLRAHYRRGTAAPVSIRRDVQGCASLAG
jgi:hypothetical protein